MTYRVFVREPGIKPFWYDFETRKRANAEFALWTEQEWNDVVMLKYDKRKKKWVIVKRETIDNEKR